MPIDARTASGGRTVMNEAIEASDGVRVVRPVLRMSEE
jgi:hypothetical protein